MAHLNPTKQFNFDDFAYFKILKLIYNVQQEVMYTIFLWMCNKPLNQTLEEYLKVQKGWTNKDYEKYFNEELRNNINKNPSGNTFDVTLLHSSIKAIYHRPGSLKDCNREKDNTDNLISLLTKMKDFRNYAIHSPEKYGHDEVIHDIEFVELNFEESLTIASKLYGKEGCLSYHMKKLQKDVANIKSTVLVKTNILEHNKELLITKGRAELSRKLNRWSQIVPLHFLGKRDFKIKVPLVYTDLQVQKDENSFSSTELLYTNMLLLDQNTPNKITKVILLKGPAGSGKTTLMKFLMHDWHSGEQQIDGLDKYQLLLYTECRTKSISSFYQLLDLSMPETAPNIEKEDLLNSICTLKILIIVDALDELNQYSEQLLHEIMEMTEKCNITLICTMREEKFQYILKLIPETIERVVVNILGIHHFKRIEFVKKYYDQLINHIDEASADINILLRFIDDNRENMGGYLTFPFNLVLLTYLWLIKPEKLHLVNTSSSLYNEIYIYSIEKLKERLVKKGYLQDLDIKIKDVFNYIHDEALYSLSLDDIILSEQSVIRIKEFCQNMNLPSDEIFSTFLVQRTQWIDGNTSEEYSYVHKGFQDFFSAKSIVNKIINENDHGNYSFSVLELLKNLPLSSKTTFDINKFRNVIMHLTGLVSLQSPMLLENFGKEIVSLNNLFGKFDPIYWFYLVTETNNNADMAKLISQKMRVNDWILGDGNISAAHTLLKYTTPNLLSLSLICNPQDLYHLPLLIERLDYISNNMELELRFHRHFQDMKLDDTNYTDDFFPVLNERCQLRVVKGALSIGGVSRLPETVQKLQLCIYSNDSAQDLENLKLPELDRNGLGIHLMRNVDPSYIKSIPYKVYSIYLFRLTDDEEDTQWAADAVAALQKDQCWNYSEVRIEEASLSLQGANKLLYKMAISGVKINNRNESGIIQFTSSNLHQNDLIELKYTGYGLWNCIVSLRSDDTSLIFRKGSRAESCKWNKSPVSRRNLKTSDMLAVFKDQ